MLKAAVYISLLVAVVADKLPENGSASGNRSVDILLNPAANHRDTRQNGPNTALHPVADATRYKKESPTTTTTEEPSFMSRVASWIFPFGRSDSEAQPSEPIARYGVPHHQQHHHHHQHHHQQNHHQSAKDCNPCNEVPWVPVASRPSKTVIGFVPPAHFNHPGTYTPPSGPVNDPSNEPILAPTASGHHNHDFSSHAILTPPVTLHLEPVSGGDTHLSPPAHIGEAHAPTNIKATYGPPAASIPHLKSTYGPPKSSFPPTSGFGTALHAQAQHLFPPSAPADHLDGLNRPPKDTYGPPQPLKIPYGPPKIAYGPPLKLPSGPPNSGHIRPLTDSYGSPFKQSSHGGQGQLYAPQFIKDYLGPPPSGHHSSKPPGPYYGPPPVKIPPYQHRPPKSHYGPPPGVNTFYGPPKGSFPPPPPLPLKYGPPPSKHAPQPPSSHKFGPPPPPAPIYNSPPLPQPHIPNKYIPVQPSIFVPPPLPPTKHHGIEHTAQIHQYAINTQYGIPLKPIPTVQSPSKVVTPTSNEYIPPPQQLPITQGSQEDLQQDTTIVHIPLYENTGPYLQPPLQPIPFPHLSAGPIPPLRQAEPFYAPDPTINTGQITTIEIHESDHGNLQHLTNIPKLPNLEGEGPYNHHAGAASHGHNDDLIKDVISHLPEQTNHYNDQREHYESQHNQHQHQHHHHHYDTSSSETIGQNNLHDVGGLLVPPPEPHYSNNHHQHLNHQQLTTEVKVVKSIPIAEFTSSIEYPASVAESPIVDIIAGEEKHHSSDITAHNEEISNEFKEHSFAAETNHADSDDSAAHGSFSQNPIIVGQDGEDFSLSDTYPAASSHNITLHGNQDVNEATGKHTASDDDAKILSTSEDKRALSSEGTKQINLEVEPSVQTQQDGHDIFNPSLINQLQGNEQHPNHNYGIITAHGVLPNETPILYLNYNPDKVPKEYNFVTPINDVQPSTHFTPPTIDYSSWAPSPGPLSTSMLPPAPNAGGLWATPTPNTLTLTEVAPEGMKPPPAPPVSAAQDEDPSKKTKHIQIIIPYTSNSRPTPFQNPGHLVEHGNWFQEQQAFLTGQGKLPENIDQVPLLAPPVDQSLLWLSNPQVDYQAQATQQHVRQTAAQEGVYTGVPQHYDDTQSVPFDILRLQQNIDEWTAQEYSEHLSKSRESVKASTTGHLVPSKKIPSEYLTTTAISNEVEATTDNPYNSNFNPSKSSYDYETAGSFRHSVHTNLHNLTIIGDLNNTLFESNLIIPETTTPELTSTTEYPSTLNDEDVGSTTEVPSEEATTMLPTTNADEYATGGASSPSTPVWEKAQIAISPLTKERVYVVTPQPWRSDEATPASAWSFTPKYNEVLDDNEADDEFAFSSPRFLVRPTPGTGRASDDTRNNVKIIYSEWPQSINNLETTTSTTAKPGARSTAVLHHLWGLMDLTPYTPPPGSSVETHSGHSKVITVVTPSTVPKKKATDVAEKKSTTKPVATATEPISDF